MTPARSATRVAERPLHVLGQKKDASRRRATTTRSMPAHDRRRRLRRRCSMTAAKRATVPALARAGRTSGGGRARSRSTSVGRPRNSAGTSPTHDGRVLDEVAPLRHEAVVVERRALGRRREALVDPCRARVGVEEHEALRGSCASRSAKRRHRDGLPGRAARQEAMAARRRRRSRTIDRPWPAATSSWIANGTDRRRPSRATIQRMGRPNGNAPLPSSSQASQLMRFGNASARRSAGEQRGHHLAGGAARDLLHEERG